MWSLISALSFVLFLMFNELELGSIWAAIFAAIFHTSFFVTIITEQNQKDKIEKLENRIKKLEGKNNECQNKQ